MVNKDTRVLVFLASRKRPQRIKEMLDSFEATKSKGTEIAIYVSDDDPTLEEYRPILNNYTHIIGPRIYQAQVFNLFASQYPDIPFYGVVNDDHMYMTKDWDSIFIDKIMTEGNGWGLACGEDKLTNWNVCQHPSACIESGNVCRTLGHFVWPKFRHIGIDRAQMFLYQSIKRLFHIPEVVIEHRHYINSRVSMDDNYKWAYGEEEQSHGHKTENEYLINQLPIDYNKLKIAMAKEGINV